jgi:hypothetical protein
MGCEIGCIEWEAEYATCGETGCEIWGVSAVLAVDRTCFDVRAGCESDASGRGPCYMDLGFTNLVLGHYS